MSKESITRDIILKESIYFIGTNGLRKISYIQLYNYLTDVKKYALLTNNDAYKTDSVYLLQVLAEITTFSMKEYDDIPKKYSLQFAATQEKIDKVHEAIETEKIRFKNTEYDVHESIYATFERELRLQKSEIDAALALNLSKTTLFIAIAAFGLITFQLLMSYLDRKNTTLSPYETKVVQQNDSIIYLLNKQYEKPEELEVVLPEIISDSILTDSIPN